MQFILHEKVNAAAVETSLHAALKSSGWSQPACGWHAVSMRLL
jgi:hypothetical protein